MVIRYPRSKLLGPLGNPFNDPWKQPSAGSPVNRPPSTDHLFLPKLPDRTAWLCPALRAMRPPWRHTLVCYQLSGFQCAATPPFPNSPVIRNCGWATPLTALISGVYARRRPTLRRLYYPKHSMPKIFGVTTTAIDAILCFCFGWRRPSRVYIFQSAE